MDRQQQPQPLSQPLQQSPSSSTSFSSNNQVAETESVDASPRFISEIDFGSPSSYNQEDSTRSRSYDGGGGRFTGPISAESNQRNRSSIANISAQFGDSVAAMLVCSAHQKLLLTGIAGKGLWFPIAIVRERESFTETVAELIRQIGHRVSIMPQSINQNRNKNQNNNNNNDNDNKMLCNKERIEAKTAKTKIVTYRSLQAIEQVRFQIPNVLGFITRMIFFAELFADDDDAIESTSDYDNRHSNNNNNNNNINGCFCDSSTTASSASTTSSIFNWISFRDIPHIAENIVWGPEPQQHLSRYIEKIFCEKAKIQSNKNNTKHRTENRLSLELYEITIRSILSPLFDTNSSEINSISGGGGGVGDSTVASAIKAMLRSAEMNEKTLLQLYTDFVQHCWPSRAMNIVSFRAFHRRAKLSLSPYPELIDAYFRSFSLTKVDENDEQLKIASSSSSSSNNRSISCRELTLGLAALDTRVPHGGEIGLLRVGYIFRYYHASECTRGLDFDDVRWFTRDLLISRYGSVFAADKAITTATANASTASPDAEGAILEREVAAVYRAFGVSPQTPLSLTTFASTIGGLQIRGTSSLFRRTETKTTDTMIAQLSTPVTPGAYPDLQQFALRSAARSCLRCRKQYTLAAHFVTLATDGTIVEPKLIRHRNPNGMRFLRTKSATTSTGSTSSAAPPPTISKMAAEKAKAARRASARVFTESDYCNELLEAIRRWWWSWIASTSASSSSSLLASTSTPQIIAPTATTKTTAFSAASAAWYTQSNAFERILALCDEACDRFSAESRILQTLSSPIVILGDIHGNLSDLLTYERALWRTSPACALANYLFLGDYVDRGDYSLECIVYLLCHKMLAPARFWLLRGNHEIRSVQREFTFQRECIGKLGRQRGLRVWEAINRVFDRLPLAAIVDDRIFAAHGGIPASTKSIAALADSIPCPMMEPEIESTPAWEVLWNDPLDERDFLALSRSPDLARSLSPSSTTVLQPAQNSQSSITGKSNNNNNYRTPTVDRRLPAGFLPNQKRGTAYFFAEEATAAFLAANGLSHVIRAHEVDPKGFAVHCRGRVLTIFSSSKYCGMLNEAAVALLDGAKIRVIKVDTRTS